MSEYIKKVGTARALQLGIYQGVPLGHAARGRGLVALADILESLLSVANHITFKHYDLKRTMANLALRYPELHDHRRPLDRWGSDIAERVFCVVNHLRRLAHSSVRLAQALHTVPEEEAIVLRGLVAKVALPSGQNSASAYSSAPVTSSEAAPESSKTYSTPQVLKPNDSMCSLDSDGFPMF